MQWVKNISHFIKSKKITAIVVHYITWRLKNISRYDMVYIVNTCYHQLIGKEGPIPFKKCINSIGQLQ